MSCCELCHHALVSIRRRKPGIAVSGWRRGPVQLLRREGFYAGFGPGLFHEHGGTHVDKDVNSCGFRKQPAQAKGTEIMSLRPVQSANYWLRTEERRVGKKGVRTCKSRG